MKNLNMEIIIFMMKTLSLIGFILLTALIIDICKYV